MTVVILAVTTMLTAVLILKANEQKNRARGYKN